MRTERRDNKFPLDEDLYQLTIKISKYQVYMMEGATGIPHHSQLSVECKYIMRWNHDQSKGPLLTFNNYPTMGRDYFAIFMKCFFWQGTQAEKLEYIASLNLSEAEDNAMQSLFDCIYKGIEKHERHMIKWPLKINAD